MIKPQQFIEAGLAIFPCNGKRPYTPNGFHDASTDPAAIKLWWDRWPDAAIGIPTGQVNGLSVIDIDNKSGGAEAALNGMSWSTAVPTPSGGYHVIVSYDPEMPTTTNIEPEVDIRNDGGYVVAYGDPAAYVDTLPCEEPERWHTPPPKTRPADQAVSGELVPDGQRHSFMLAMAGQLRRAGLVSEEILPALQMANERRCDPPLEDHKIEKLAYSMDKYDSGAPVTPQENPDFYSLADIKESAWAQFNNPIGLRGVSTGFKLLDEALGGGLRKSELTLIHAVPKTGKSTLIHQIMLSLANAGHVCGYASREMRPVDDLYPEFVSVLNNVNAFNKKPTKEQFDKVAELPIYFASGYGVMDVNHLDRFVQSMVALGAQYLFIDHLHYMVGEDNDVNKIGHMMRALKQYTNDYGVHIVLIVQPKYVEPGVKLGLRTLKGGSSISETMDNLITMQRAEDVANVTQVCLVAARFKLATQGYEFFFSYDKDTSRLTEGQLQPVDSEKVPEGNREFVLDTEVATR